MANGFFLGGMAEGQATAQKQDLAERTLTQDTGLRSRALDLTERAQTTAQQQANVTRVDKQIADTMSVVAETIKAARESGKDPVLVQKAVAPLVTSAKQLAGAVGRDPASLDAQVQALLVNPSAIDKAAVEGRAEAAKTIAKTTDLKNAGVNVYGIDNPKDRATAENTLRDDYVKQSQNFVKMAEQKQRLDSIETTGAGDVALVFTYMKMLDPTSTVREGEYATASNAAGIPSAVQALYNKMLGGGVLGGQARKDIKSQAVKFYQKEANQQDKRTTQYAGVARRQGLDPNNVVIDLGINYGGDIQTTPGGTKFKVLK